MVGRVVVAADEHKAACLFLRDWQQALLASSPAQAQDEHMAMATREGRHNCGTLAGCAAQGRQLQISWVQGKLEKQIAYMARAGEIEEHKGHLTRRCHRKGNTSGHDRKSHGGWPRQAMNRAGACSFGTEMDGLVETRRR